MLVGVDVRRSLSASLSEGAIDAVAQAWPSLRGDGDGLFLPGAYSARRIAPDRRVRDATPTEVHAMAAKKRKARTKATKRNAKAAKAKPRKAAASPKKAGKKVAKKKTPTKKSAKSAKSAKRPAPSKKKPTTSLAKKRGPAGSRKRPELDEDIEQIGSIDVPSGVICVCDAGTLMSPVRVKVRPGSWQVTVLNNGRNTSAIAHTGSAIATWEQLGAYPVDAGMAAFVDDGLHQRLERHQFPTSIYDDLISKHLDPAEAQGHFGALVPFGDTAFAAFASGFGDGMYPVVAGIGEDGEVAAILTLFQ